VSSSPSTDRLLDRVVVPDLVFIVRDGKTLCYATSENVWHRLTTDVEEVLRWLRAGRPRSELTSYLSRRLMTVDAAERIEASLRWAVLRRLLHLDGNKSPTALPPPRPAVRTVYWIATQACNLRCTYCYQDAAEALPNELSTEEALRLMSQVKDAGADTVIFTGGEPFARSDLMEVAKCAKTIGLRTSVITNGHYITTRNVTRVVEVFDNFTVSLDSGTPAPHDRSRGAGSWDRAFRAIRLLRHEGAPVDMNSTIMPEAVEGLDDLIKIAIEQSVDEHRIVPQFPMGRGGESRTNELPVSDFFSFGRSVLEARRRQEGKSLPKSRVDGVQPHAKGTFRNHCGAGVSEVSVDPEGWVYPCRLIQGAEHRIGNVRTQQLDALLQGAYLERSVRRNTANIQMCRTCVIRNYCGGGCRGVHSSYSGSPDKNSVLFCTFLRNGFELNAWSTTGDVPSGLTYQWGDNSSSSSPYASTESLVQIRRK
jgi:radical SAM protein with 4Fe4S-binding SPASM domain